jgi:hypothetical protein
MSNKETKSAYEKLKELYETADDFSAGMVNGLGFGYGYPAYVGAKEAITGGKFSEGYDKGEKEYQVRRGRSPIATDSGDALSILPGMVYGAGELNVAKRLSKDTANKVRNQFAKSAKEDAKVVTEKMARGEEGLEARKKAIAEIQDLLAKEEDDLANGALVKGDKKRPMSINDYKSSKELSLEYPEEEIDAILKKGPDMDVVEIAKKMEANKEFIPTSKNKADRWHDWMGYIGVKSPPNWAISDFKELGLNPKQLEFTSDYYPMLEKSIPPSRWAEKIKNDAGFEKLILDMAERKQKAGK